MNEQVRYVRLGSIPKPGEAGRVPRASYSAGDEIVVRYNEPGGLTRSSPVSSPSSKLARDQGAMTVEGEGSTIAPPETQPTRVQLKI